MFNGILPVWKAKGLTSHDVVFKLRRILKMKKIGHTGTLDPEVEGVLVICLGNATKLVETIMDSDKIYQGEITLGFSTETEDAHGTIVEQVAVTAPVSTELIDQKMAEFKGWVTQVPPYYSAVKVNGRKLYEYARAGETVERPERQVMVDHFKRTSEPVFDASEQTQQWEFEVKCGKGTYVRTLAVDLGKSLGYPSHMSQLTRTASGGFSGEEAYTLEEIQELMDQNQVESALQTISSALKDFPSLELTESQFVDVTYGKVLPYDYFDRPILEPTVLYYDQTVKAIYQPHPTKAGLIKPDKMFLS